MHFLEDQESWHREAYFGVLLNGKRHVVQLLETSPYKIEMGGTSKMAYAIVFEYCSNGSLLGYLNPEKLWPEKRVIGEVTALLRVLTELHAGGVLHRDITPMNILVDLKGHLKLADFGIAGQALPSTPLMASKFNPAFAPPGKVDWPRSKWGGVDDVYQMGLLLEYLLSGGVSGDKIIINGLSCAKWMRNIVIKAVGPRLQRYPSAYEMMMALEGENEGEMVQTVRTLHKKRVVFTGPLSIRRSDAAVLVLQKGGVVQPEVYKNTDLLVIGGRSPLYKHKHKGDKIVAAEKLKKKGFKIKLINEAQFLRLVR